MNGLQTMSFDDPTDFEGILPNPGPGEPTARKKPRNNAATGASAAGVRAFTAQAIAFYFRAPVKTFFRTRVDYMVCDKFLPSRSTFTLTAAANTKHQPLIFLVLC